MVLDDLVLDEAHAGLLCGHLGKRDPCLVSCCSGSLEDLVDLFLRIGREDRLCLAHLGHTSFERFNRIDDTCCLNFFFHLETSLDMYKGCRVTLTR